MSETKEVTTVVKAAASLDISHKCALRQQRIGYVHQAHCDLEYIVAESKVGEISPKTFDPSFHIYTALYESLAALAESRHVFWRCRRNARSLGGCDPPFV